MRDAVGSLLVLAGYVAARWAGIRHVAHGTAVGVLGTALGALTLLLPLPEESYFAPWVPYASVVATLLLGSLGGFVARPAA